MQALGAGYKNYFRFSGRATLEEYWYFWMFFFGLVALGLTLDITCMGGAHQAAAQLRAMTVSAKINADQGSVQALQGLRSKAIITAAPVFLLFGLGIVVHLVSLSAVCPILAVHVRRLHDTGRSGWWTILAVVGWLKVFGNIVGMILPATLQRTAAHSSAVGLIIGLMMLSPVFLFLLQPGNGNYNKFDYGRY